MKKALKLNAKTLIIIGEDEHSNNKVTVKNTKTEVQETINLKDLVKQLEKELGY